MAAESFGYIFIGAFPSWKQQCCLQGWGSRSISIAVPLGQVVSREVGGGGSSRRHRSVRSTVLLCGEARAGLELVSLGHHTAGLCSLLLLPFQTKEQLGPKPFGE